MDIQEIKKQLGVANLNLNFSQDKDGNPTQWLRHWDDANRVAISLHKDTFEAIVKDGATTLGIQTETRISTSEDPKEYTAHRIVMYTPAEFTL
jgi:hypothetical protein